MSEKNQFDPNSKEIKSAINLILKKQKFSTAMLQTYLGKGHTYVTSLADWLEDLGIIGPENGNEPREILISSMDEFLKKTAGKSLNDTMLDKEAKQDDKTSITTRTIKNGNKYSWIWVLITLVIVFGIASSNAMKGDTNNNQPATTEETQEESVTDYTGQDAKKAYTDLTSEGYTVKFIFDRNNNGGFTDEEFQKFVIDDSFTSSSYSELPFTVTKQYASDKNITLYIEYSSAVNEKNTQQNREAKLEEKLSIITAMSTCELYGKRNYRNFKLHSIVGKIAEYAIDDDTWLLKYTVDANGYKNLNMECYVTGTDDSPTIKDFNIY